ncbi:hypothetical protein CONPUDRAFT_156867 [Coniophora puteana RWD-64-598 SS2]|uniref:Uncharacterized protein n=1 Tax=Coniophora puteana (strain RWD-64-598) TaxID=741705 RepID=A0A5M3MEH8_CONPW|nr:uncharacterized protein CONPUDRAFT_156867 [Coniophora puteana RWD-64-598 SS2]EIW77679.1 hypothetical protein CONPUDRAFT_156867 [Coniophora puteana RWD-64-598 SS2]
MSQQPDSRPSTPADGDLDPLARLRASRMSSSSNLSTNSRNMLISEPALTQEAPLTFFPDVQLDASFSSQDSFTFGGSATSTATSASPCDILANIQLGNTLKSGFKLSAQAERDFDAWCKSPTYQHQLTLLCLFILSRDQAAPQVDPGLWKPSNALLVDIKTYARAFVLCPSVSHYLGNSAKYVLDAMRSLRVTSVPPEHENFQITSSQSAISTKLTHVRSRLKGIVGSCSELGSEHANIADFAVQAQALCKRTKITVAMYIRLAFLRWVYNSYPQSKGDTYWQKVDECLKDMSKKCTNLTLSQDMIDIYNNDVEKYGDPSSTSHNVVDSHSIDEWQTRLNTYAAKVQPETKRGAKRTRTST